MVSGDGTGHREAGGQQDALLVGHLYGELSEEDEEQLTRALARDPALVEEMEQFERILEAYRSLPPEEPPADIADFVLAAAAEQAKKNRGETAEIAEAPAGKAGPVVAIPAEGKSSLHAPGMSGLGAWIHSLFAVPRRRLGLALAVSVCVALGAGLILWRTDRTVTPLERKPSMKMRSVAMKKAEDRAAGRPEDEASFTRPGGGIRGIRKSPAMLSDDVSAARVPSREHDKTLMARQVVPSPRRRAKRKIPAVRGRTLAPRSSRAMLGGIAPSATNLGGVPSVQNRPMVVSGTGAVRDGRRDRTSAHRSGKGGYGRSRAAAGRGSVDSMAEEAAPPPEAERLAARRLLRAGRYRKALVLYRRLSRRQQFTGNPLFLLEWAEAELMAGSITRTMALATRVEKTSRKLRPRALALKRRARHRRAMRSRAAAAREVRKAAQARPSL